MLVGKEGRRGEKITYGIPSSNEDVQRFVPEQRGVYLLINPKPKNRKNGKTNQK